MSKILININVFTPEIRKNIFEILEAIFSINIAPNPTAEGLQPHADGIIENILDKFGEAGMSTSYGNIFKMMCKRLELINNFLTVDFFKSITKHIANPVFDISSEALSVLEGIIISDDKLIQNEVKIRILIKFNTTSFFVTVYLNILSFEI